MKTIKIAHLYYDLMNYYGEQGNVLALKTAIEYAGFKVNVKTLSVDDEIDFEKYDIFYMGMGTKRNQEIVRKDILKYKDKIENVIDKKMFIMTGNSYELFGKKIDDKKCLGVFNFESRTTDRIVGEQVLKCDIIKETIIGFQNRFSSNNIKDDFLFEVIKGTGNDLESKVEGIHKNNFFGTYLLGPILIRNPYFKDALLKYIGIDKVNTKLVDYKAYHEYLKNFNIN
ncbi:predicted glutamine amidotransferase [Firmicutes bacterium CAG:582]|nr:predicted glutamine amidotransferase [Firmicutes bacterium CAG:582]